MDNSGRVGDITLSVKLRLRLTLLFFMELMDMLDLDMLVTDMLVLGMLMLASPLLPVDMLVLAVMSPTPLELSMLPSVRLRPRLTLLSFMEPTDMLDTDMLVTDMLVLDMLVSLDILMPLTVLDMPDML